MGAILEPVVLLTHYVARQHHAQAHVHSINCAIMHGHT